jgi:hypothetical protein
MHRILTALFLALISTAKAQVFSGRLQFQQGQQLVVTMEIQKTLTQQAGGQAINFSASGSALHHYEMTDQRGDTIWLRYQAGPIRFQFEGMGQKRSFDSRDATSHTSEYGKLLEGVLKRTYSLGILPNGVLVSVKPDTVSPSAPVADVTIITELLGELTGINNSLKLGEASFFAILPAGTRIGETRKLSQSGDVQREITLAAITDSTVVVDFKSSSNDRTPTVGASLAKTSKTDHITGKAIFSKQTNIIREISATTESRGHTEAMGSKTPIIGRSVLHITVR